MGKTVFKTHHGHFQFRVMSSGLANVPATFYCVMNAAFAHFLWKFVIVFLDDILIYSANWEGRMHHVRTAYKTQTDIVCGKAFQVFFWEAVYISDEGVATDPDNIGDRAMAYTQKFY